MKQSVQSRKVSKKSKKYTIKKQQSNTKPVNKHQLKKSSDESSSHVYQNVNKFVNRKNRSLKERMEMRIKAAKFRILNERLYTSDKEHVKTIFDSRNEFDDYHEGFRLQVNQWPVNPLSIIIKSIQRCIEKIKDPCIADFGCGEAELAKTLSCKVHSFDLFATNVHVTACDMAKTKLPSESIDIAVFCLSLMGSSNSRYVQEANRVLKVGGLLKIAEVESRFDDSNKFVNDISKHGFELISQNLSHNVFLFFNFKKISNISKKRKNKLPDIALSPCLYKKR